MRLKPMRLRLRALIAGALSILVAAPALADPRHGGDYRDGRDYRDRGHHERTYRGDLRRYDFDNRDDRRDERHAYRDGYRDGRRADARYDRYDSYGRVVYARPYYRDTYYAPRYRVGDRFPSTVRYRVVSDYDRYRLPPPRRGHYYAECDDGDILLVAAATGLIVWALTN